MTEKDIIEIIKKDSWMMDVLIEAEKLNLPDWMIAAGFLRNKVWNYLHDIERAMVDTRDVDLVYFDKNNSSELFDENLSKKMNGKLGIEWEIVNQVYTHKWHDRGDQYIDTEDAISNWAETATCIGVTIKKGELKIIAPHGIDDLVNMIVRPGPAFLNNLDFFHSRYKDKKWLKKWSKLRVVV